MKKLLFSLLVLGTSLSLYGQDETRNLDDFSDLDVSTSIELELIPSSTNKAEIDVIRGDIDDLRVENTRGNLRIYFKSKNGYNNRKAKIKLYYDGIESIEVSAGAYVYSDKAVEGDDFEAEVSSGGKLSIDLNTDKLESEVSSGGSLEIEGTATSLSLDVSSGGSFKGGDFKCKKVSVEATSGGHASVYASDHIEAEADSGGGIKYKGNPASKDIEKDKWSGGTVKASNF